jgi:hypothetical protein
VSAILALIRAGVTSVIPSSFTLYLIAAVALASAWGTWRVCTWAHDAEVARQVQVTRMIEGDVATIGNRHERAALAAAEQRRKDAENALQTLRRRLAAAPRCDVPVPPQWLPERAPAVPGAARDPARAGPAAPPLDPVADARTVVETCERNRLEVYEAEADERERIRAWYRELRERVNRR